jgi:hypothetical protein
MLKKVAIGAAGLGAFIVAAILVSLISSIVSALIPGRSPDPPGQLDQPIEEKSKQEYEATLNPKEQPKTNESQDENQPATPSQETSTPQEAVPSPAPVPVAPPAPRSSGPGNFDAPPAPYGGGGIYPSGPGNM